MSVELCTYEFPWSLSGNTETEYIGVRCHCKGSRKAQKIAKESW